VVSAAGATEVIVAPITPLEPFPPSEGIELPGKVKQHLGLDDARSWVVVTDLNVFTWPGFDLHPIPDAPSGTFDYGFLPPKLHRRIADRIDAIGAVGRATNRD
jgi:hypothetical protein